MPEEGKKGRAEEETKSLEEEVALTEDTLKEIRKNLSELLKETDGGEDVSEENAIQPKSPEEPEKIPVPEKPKEEKPKQKPPQKETSLAEQINKLETNIDRLYRLVKERGEIKVSEAAKIFRVGKTEIEKWGQVLQDHNLVELHYPLIGEAVLRVKKQKKVK